MLSQIYCRSAHTGSMSETLNLDNKTRAEPAREQRLRPIRLPATMDALAADISILKGSTIHCRVCARSIIGCTPWRKQRVHRHRQRLLPCSPLTTMATPESHGHKCPAPTAVAHGGNPATNSPIRRSLHQIRRQRAIRMLHCIEDTCAKWPERTYQALSSHQA